MGKETHTHTRAWVEEGRLERLLGTARLDPLPTLPGTQWWWRQRWPVRFPSRSSALRGLGGQRGGRGMRGGRRARAERQEARSRRLVTVRLGAHGCAREPGGQAPAPLNQAPGTWAPRRRCPRFHPQERPAHPAGLSQARAAEIQLSVQGQDRNSASRVSRTGNFSLTRCCPSPTPGFKTKQKTQRQQPTH